MSADRKLPDSAAEVSSGWSIVWTGSEPIASVLARHPGVRIGSRLYTADQLTAYGAEREALGRRRGLEEAAKLCDDKQAARSRDGFAREASTARALAAAIRQLAKE